MTEPTFRLILPMTNLKNKGDISTVKTRDWLVPGEKVILYIEIENLSVYDYYSYNCAITLYEEENNHASDQDEKKSELLEISSLVPSFSSQSFEEFKNDSGLLYVPISISCPVKRCQYLDINLYYNNTEIKASLRCKMLIPFTIYKNYYYAPQSIIMSFKIYCNFPGFNEDIFISSSSLRFDENAITGMNHFNDIIIVPSNDISQKVMNEDVFGVAYALKPLNDSGQALLNALPLLFQLTWRTLDNSYTFVYDIKANGEKSNFVITAPSVSTTLLKMSKMQLTIAAVGEDLPKVVKLLFGEDKVQPMESVMSLEFTERERVKSIDFLFIPLTTGQHELDVALEFNGKLTRPLLPVYINVCNSENPMPIGHDAEISN